MALIHCAECRREISDRAAACPHCGAPLAAIERGVVTTQATGKGPKIAQLIGVALMALGVASCIGQSRDALDYLTPIWTFFLGGAIWFVGRLAAWWKHG